MLQASRSIWTVLAAAAMFVAAGAAQAVPSYGGVASVGGNDGGPDNDDGIYFGTGNVDGDFTIDTSNGIEVALRVKNRATLQTIAGPSGLYQVDRGLCNPACPGAPKAAWNYEFSVNLRAGGGTLDFGDVRVELGIDTDPGAGTSFNFIDVLNNWPDNYYWDGDRRIGTTPEDGEYGVQQSVNPLFVESGFMPGFDVNAPGLYEIQLSVYDLAGTLLARTAITVQAAPAPATPLLLGLGVLALGLLRRRTAG